MDQTTLLRAHVERVLQDAWDVKDLKTEPDGDYPFEWGSAACWVRVRPPLDQEDLPSVEAFALAGQGLKRSAKLLTEINDLNGSARWVKIALERDRVYVSRLLHMAGADRDALLSACTAVGTVAAQIGPVLTVVHGGVTPHPADAPSDQEPQ